MKRIFILLMSFLFSAALVVQSVTIKGKFISASDGEGLPYASISVAREATLASTTPVQ